MLQKGIDEPLESHVKSNQTTFCKLAAGWLSTFKKLFPGGRDLLKVLDCSCYSWTDTAHAQSTKQQIHSDKNLRGSKSTLKVVHRLQKINVQVFCWLNSANNFKSIVLQGFQKLISTVKSPEAGKCYIFVCSKYFSGWTFWQPIWLPYSTWFSYSTGHFEVILLCFSLLQYQPPQLTSDLLFLWTFFSSHNANNEKKT